MEPASKGNNLINYSVMARELTLSEGKSHELCSVWSKSDRDLPLGTQ